MEYIHIRNLQKYHPGYKDRTLQWAKIYFKVVQGDPDCEMITDEIDWGRLIKFILLELEAQKPIPIDDKYLTRKGFDLKKKPISLTLNMLHNFLEVIHSDVDIPTDTRHVDKDKSRVEESRVDKKENVLFDFESIWSKYPSKVGKEAAARKFKLTVKTDQDFKDIQTALDNYIKSDRVTKGFIQNGSTWFNQWRDWIVSPKENNESIPSWVKR